MPRKGPAPRRELMPDPVYRSVLVTQLVNKVLAARQALARRAHRLRRARHHRGEDRRRADRHAEAGDRQREAAARGEEPPRRWRHLPGAGRGAPAPGQHARHPLDRRLRPPAPGEDDGRSAWPTSCSTPPTASARRSSAATTCRRWPSRTRPSPTTAGRSPDARRCSPGCTDDRACSARSSCVPRPPVNEELTSRHGQTARVPPRARPATSGSWPTSTRARPRRPSASSTTPARPTRSVRSTRAPRRWTTWCRSRSAASRSRRPPPPASGTTTASTSSTRPATSTSPSRSSGRCACSTAPSRCSTRSPASSRRPRRCGARPTSTACRACASSTRWTASAPTSSAPSQMIKDRLEAMPAVIQLPIGAEGHYRGVVDLVKMKALDLARRGAGRGLGRGRHPGRARERRPHEWRTKLLDVVASQRRRPHGEVPRRRGARPEDDQARPSARAPSPSPSCRCCAARRSRTRASSRCSTPSSTSCRRPLDIPPTHGHRRQGHRGARAPGRRGRAVRRARVQDRRRPVRQAHLLPRLLGQDRQGRRGLQLDQGSQGARSAASC